MKTNERGLNNNKTFIYIQNTYRIYYGCVTYSCAYDTYKTQQIKSQNRNITWRIKTLELHTFINIYSVYTRRYV